MRYGLQIIEREPEDYVFGSAELSEKVINPSGDWTDFLPDVEYQKKGTCETMSCVSFGTLSIIETLAKYIYGFEWNKSDRFTAIMSETTESGNSPNKVAQSIRHDGTILEDFLPFSKDILTFDNYMSPQPMKPEYLVFGAKWAEEWELTHRWINNTPSEIREALKRSPLGVSVHAWKEKDGIYYKDENDTDNHWTVLFKMNDDGTYQIFDTYDSTIKTLKAGYAFAMIKGYEIKPRQFVAKKNWVIDIYNNLISFLKDIWKSIK